MRSNEDKANITVVVPVYKVDRFLGRCVDSLLAQTLVPKEIILVDDGSPDASGAICDEYASRHDLIRVIHKENGGLSSARKAGFQAAKGELIVFVDSDDYVVQGYIEKLARPFADPDVDLSLCAYATVCEGRISNSDLPYSADSIPRNNIARDYTLPLMGSVTVEGALNIPGFVQIRMYRTAKLKESDFVSEREYFTEDIILNILYASRIQGRIAVVNEPLYRYCVNPGSLTLKFRENAFAMLYACWRLCSSLTENLVADADERRKRLDANLTAAVTYSVYNIGQIKEYGRFRRELRQILSTPEVVALFSGGRYPRKATWHKIIYYTCRFRLFPLLYLLLKTRKTL